ncbi:MAG TPA: phosphodiester glycosidase family protein [Verrucomicrobiae bacterium]|jgi:hypothetical protein|nr:phosphodiester glycosidase family protein [Verrucomicrobiae bacterium]
MKTLALLFLAFACGCAAPIRFRYETQKNPPNRLWIAEINLADPRVQVRVAPGGPDPDGPGPWQTTLMAPTLIAARENFDLVVNGDFFEARNVRDAEGAKSGYRANQWASAVGPAMTDGIVWSVAAHPRPCLVVHENSRITIEPVAHPSADDRQVISGNVMLVTNGVAVPQTNHAKHPRTVAGLNARHTKLTLVVVDGRKPGVAAGMEYSELATEMIHLGCDTALNLDGGGSSLMAARDGASRAYRILNQPTDGHERPVADVLGVTIRDR